MVQFFGGTRVHEHTKCSVTGLLLATSVPPTRKGYIVNDLYTLYSILRLLMLFEALDTLHKHVLPMPPVY